ncbi:MAG: GIY-YIG nuclease family protein [Firmicutes bacterium]|nr:GIY-YIG nuclease family protein [Bacillota bacterium]
MDNTYTVYILTNYTRTVLYTGVTNNIQRRLFEYKNNPEYSPHRNFVQDNNCYRLVYMEHTTSVDSAILREKQIKKWRRERRFI